MKARYAFTLALGLVGTACRGGRYQAAPAPQPAVAASPAGPRLYERLGGVDAIRAVVDNFVGRVGADARINTFFRGVDLDNFKRLLTEQICRETGGPCRYTGRSMRETHTGMNLTDAHFNALVEDLVGALNQFNVPEREKSELLGALGGMKGDIVGW
ncbi:MAG: group 1 truncated hemoglobin [Gemmatimonadales bacterium]|nr:group 1 truncated hemoglobin [Gemmatimonadales bacterium]